MSFPSLVAGSRVGRALQHPFLAWGVIALWAVVVWFARPSEVVLDWMGWRQADTLAIARNFIERPTGILFPRIDWGGDGPGFVEAELQLLPLVVSWSWRVLGQRDWLAQLLSLVCMCLTAGMLVSFLRVRYGAIAALFGLAVWLSSRGVVFSATAVQPDVLSLTLSMLAISSFARWVETREARHMVTAMAATALAAAIKPTALWLGVAQFALLLLARRDLLRRPAPWIGWSLVVACNVALLWHARSLYLEFGNTFGILSGGDRKTPTLEHLAHPRLLVGLLGVSLNWGIGWLGAVAALWLLVRRRFSAFEWALAAGNAALLLVSLRYAQNEHYGSHYHLPTTLLGALLVGHAVAEAPPKLAKAWAGVAFTAFALFGFGRALAAHRRVIADSEHDGAIAVGRVLRRTVRPGELVVIRSVAPAREGWWNVPNNYQDPRTLYIAHARGWVLPVDCECARELSELVDKRARYYVDWGDPIERPELDRVLERRATLLHDRGDLGRIFRLGAQETPNSRSVVRQSSEGSPSGK